MLNYSLNLNMKVFQECVKESVKNIYEKSKTVVYLLPIPAFSHFLSDKEKVYSSYLISSLKKWQKNPQASFTLG